MDIKIKGLKYEILVEALHQAKKGRLEILEKLDSSIQIANDTVKPHAPKMVNIEIPKDFKLGLIVIKKFNFSQESLKNAKHQFLDRFYFITFSNVN